MSKSARAQSPAAKRPDRPRDIAQLAHFLVAEATREGEPAAATELAAPIRKPRRKKSSPKVEAGRLGGLASAEARMEKIPPERRREIAKAAAAARWAKSEDPA